MQRLIPLLIALLLCALPCAAAEETAEEESWFGLSAGNTVLTVRLDSSGSGGLSWNFEISNPAALELITQEVLEDGSISGVRTTYVGSFMSVAGTESSVSLILKNSAAGEEIPVNTRVLEIRTGAGNTLDVAAVLERDPNAAWLESGSDGRSVTVRLPGSAQWEIVNTGPEIISLTGGKYAGSDGVYTARCEGVPGATGLAELSFTNESVTYTVNLSVETDGEITVRWAEIFRITDSGATLRNHDTDVPKSSID